jgi:cyclase
MTCTRRDLLRLTALTVTATGVGRRELLAQTAPGAPAAQTPPTEATPVFTELRRNVGTFTARGGTIGWLINPGGIAVIDTQFPDTAKLCLDGIKTRAANRGIDVVINTHHHGDHTGGNGAFRDAAKKIVAHQRVPELMKMAAANAQKANPNAPPLTITVPDTTFPDTWKTDLGDEVVSAKYYGPAHTGGDIVIRLERANIAHMGDLMFNRRHPFIDRAAGASIAGWISVLERVTKELPNDTLYIFGHSGPKFPVTGAKADLDLQRDYFNALLDFTRAQIKGGKTRDEFIKSTETLDRFPDHGPLIERTLSAAYDEVSSS